MMCRWLRIRIYLRKEVDTWTDGWNSEMVVNGADDMVKQDQATDNGSNCFHPPVQFRTVWLVPKFAPSPKMEASVRLLASTAALRRPIPLPPPPVLRSISLPNPNPKSLSHLPFSKSTQRHFPFPFPFPSSPSSSPSPRSHPFSPLSLSLSLSLSSLEPAHGSSQWGLLPDGSPQGHDLGFGGDRGATFTVVLLGWLGAEQRHLRKYAEIYNARGIRSVQLVVPVREVLGFDLGRRIEERIGRFAREIADWCAEKDGDGRERYLIFHTFSNTGWLTGKKQEQSRADILEKIKGCIVDSGAAAEISPQVWAAGFCAALLKKRSSLTYSSGEAFEGSKQDVSLHKLNDESIRPSLGEIIIFSLLLKFFNIVLSLPDVNRRLSKVISVLSKNQPSWPQLYLYSFADRVIPAESVENFIKEQKTLGRDVYAYNFGSSPHVDHFRSFPQLYTAKIDEFLKICSSVTV
ncbi:transmembrane protein 53-like isoform X2 [Ananas comosus]|uniref:Transmembrane protein 53-like isoform X2 n=1 Tax=Ananas comosus TaxID=4615 RepID=A0A6P5FYL4_ANACO|nr:transmembrane protein 53-like isoform X2 [Ananas comosus]